MRVCTHQAIVNSGCWPSRLHTTALWCTSNDHITAAQILIFLLLLLVCGALVVAAALHQAQVL